VLVSAAEGHRVWAPTYDDGLNPLLALEERILGPLHASTAIDVGCGTGRWTARLNAFGIDRSPEMLRRASRNPSLCGHLLLADAAALPFASGVSDLTLCSFAVSYISDLPAATCEMVRVTKCGGQVIVTDLHPDAVAAGWTRSFRAGGTIYEMEHRPTAVVETIEAMRRFGLLLAHQHEACFGEPERPIFEAARKSLDEVAGIPAVWIGIWTKP
jgi:ubiquinone/menaquinone biosynthesis C-methylase UbiE